MIVESFYLNTALILLASYLIGAFPPAIYAEGNAPIGYEASSIIAVLK